MQSNHSHVSPVPLALAITLLASLGQAQLTQVVPPAWANTPANSSTAYPWGRTTTDTRVQYCYDSSYFTSASISYPIVVNRLRWRALPTTASWTGGTWGNVIVSCSSAAVDFAAMTTTFASNHGPDLTQVFTGAVTLAPGTGNGAGVPGPWYIDVVFNAPFLYDPSLGSDFLVDLQVQGASWTGGTTSSLECEYVTTGTTTLATRMYNLTTYNAATGSLQAYVAPPIEVNYAPASGLFAGFTATPTSGAAPLTVQFTDRSYSSDPGGIVAWLWDFDGDTVIDSTLQNPSFVYTGSGEFSPTLTVIDASHPQAMATRGSYIRTDQALTAVPFTGGNGASSATVVGNMFDVSVLAAEGISVGAITQAIHTYSGPFDADIYITPTSYVGKDGNAALWRLVGSGHGIAAAGTIVSPSHNLVVLGRPIYLPSGSYGVAVLLRATPSGTMYVCDSNGPQGPFGNADLSINPNFVAPGITKTDLFGATSLPSRCWNGTLHYTKTSLNGVGGHGFFGEGCASRLGITGLSAAARPTLGQTLAVTADNLPLNVAIGLLGLSRTNSAYGPLPLDLSPLGAPGCFLRVRPDAMVLLLGVGNSTTWSLPLPNVPTLLSVRANQQLLVLDSAANALGVVASDAAGLVIGR